MTPAETGGRSLEFAANDFLRICHIFGEIRGRHQSNKPLRSDVYGDGLTDLLGHCGRLGFTVTRDQVYSMMVEIGNQTPGSLSIVSDGNTIQGMQVKDGKMDWDRTAHYADMLYGTLQSEIGNILFAAIPRERIEYCKPEWLKDTPIPDKFPTSLKELIRAGHCYALGEPTACVFHSMRAFEPALNALADNFAISYAQENWHNIIQQVEAAIRNLGNQPKSQQKMEDEKFFGNAASALYFVKNAWRNHVAHGRDSYSDDEAFKIMQHTVQFIESLCPRISEPGMKP
jgi:hypothetical protein